MTYEWWSVAGQKVWEGFFYAIGSGVALALVVGIAVHYIRKGLEATKKTVKHNAIRKFIDNSLDKLVGGYIGTKRRERITRSKKKTIQSLQTTHKT